MRNSESEEAGREFDVIDFDSLEDIYGIMAIVKERPMKTFRRYGLIHCICRKPIEAEKGYYAHTLTVMDFCNSCNASFKLVSEMEKSNNSDCMDIEDFTVAHDLVDGHKRRGKCYNCMLADGDTILKKAK